MKDVLRRCEVFSGLSDSFVSSVAAIARRQTFAAGEHPFLLGQAADRLFVVLAGRVDLCVPISILGSMRDVTVETKGVGSALGWSAFVKPNRFRLSARAAEPSELAAVSREELVRLFAQDGDSGRRFVERIAEITAQRLLAVQALWVRELQRSVLGADGSLQGARADAMMRPPRPDATSGGAAV